VEHGELKPCTQVLEVEDTGGFAKIPLALEDFSGRFKTAHTCNIL
jgi:hypothetical protein